MSIGSLQKFTILLPVIVHIPPVNGADIKMGMSRIL
jgi:hypothetical protein